VSLFPARSARVASLTSDLEVPGRERSRTGSVEVTQQTALRHSAVWACLRVRADLISTMPVDAYRKVGGVQVEVAKPPVFTDPGGGRMKWHEWMYSSQVDLDRAGNAIGIITARDGLQLPARIELQDLAQCSIVSRNGEEFYRIDGKRYEPEDVWHERQYTLPGLRVGLSPVAYAAWSIGQFLSAQQFALDWFTDGAIPTGTLRNTEKTVDKASAKDIKSRFRAAVAGRDLFVHGKDWEYKPIQAVENARGFIETQQFGIADAARWFGVPGDIIDAAVSTGSITYASISQRNLQLLIINIGPPVFRREAALSDLVPGDRFIKLNSDALLRMDPETRAKVLGQQVKDRLVAPSEARELDNRQPYTEDQYAEFDRLFGAPKKDKTKDAAEVIQKTYLGVGKVITSDEAREIANTAGANLPIPGPEFGATA